MARFTLTLNTLDAFFGTYESQKCKSHSHSVVVQVSKVTCNVHVQFMISWLAFNMHVSKICPPQLVS